ncbi:hypothetical protein ACF1G0_13070 [Streptomyces sp. NPDC013953]|uniref:hypothetical protein n=1 Tax=Streptomyces sp. NPDC013953 TaxID=3364868 RepID=UPI0036FEE24F
MALEEKRAWTMAVVSISAYLTYLVIVLGRADGIPLTEVPYVTTLLWTVGAAVVGSIVLHAVAAMGSCDEGTTKDQRDREISRFGEYTGQSFLVIGGIAVLVMAMAEVDHFWIANTICLAFFLSAVLGSAARIAAYRWGFQPW